VVGAGPPLVLIPGTFGDRRSWFKQLGLLSPQFQCVLFDPRGVGDTPDPGKPFTPDDLADDVLAVMDSAHLDRAHLLGHSLGAGVALLMAARHPDRVRKVVAAAPTLFMDAYLLAVMDVWEALAGSNLPDHEVHSGLVSTAFGRGAFDRLVPAVVREMDRQPIARDTIRRYVECDRRQDLRPHLGRVDADVLVVVGADDALSGVDQARNVAAAIPSARLEVVSGVGHSPHIEATSGFGKLVRDFLNS
jgi:pimeloyl-ACP methyl ester carboxylesterase